MKKRIRAITHYKVTGEKRYFIEGATIKKKDLPDIIEVENGEAYEVANYEQWRTAFNIMYLKGTRVEGRFVAENDGGVIDLSVFSPVSSSSSSLKSSLNLNSKKISDDEHWARLTKAAMISNFNRNVLSSMMNQIDVDSNSIETGEDLYAFWKRLLSTGEIKSEEEKAALFESEIVLAIALFFASPPPIVATIGGGEVRIEDVAWVGSRFSMFSSDEVLCNGKVENPQTDTKMLAWIYRRIVAPFRQLDLLFPLPSFTSLPISFSDEKEKEKEKEEKRFNCARLVQPAADTTNFTAKNEEEDTALSAQYDLTIETVNEHMPLCMRLLANTPHLKWNGRSQIIPALVQMRYSEAQITDFARTQWSRQSNWKGITNDIRKFTALSQSAKTAKIGTPCIKWFKGGQAAVPSTEETTGCPYIRYQNEPAKLLSILKEYEYAPSTGSENDVTLEDAVTIATSPATLRDIETLGFSLDKEGPNMMACACELATRRTRTVGAPFMTSVRRYRAISTFSSPE